MEEISTPGDFAADSNTNTNASNKTNTPNWESLEFKFWAGNDLDEELYKEVENVLVDNSDTNTNNNNNHNNNNNIDEISAGIEDIGEFGSDEYDYEGNEENWFNINSNNGNNTENVTMKEIVSLGEVLIPKIDKILSRITVGNVKQSAKEFLHYIIEVYVYCLDTLEYVLNLVIEHIINNYNNGNKNKSCYYEFLKRLLVECQSVINGFEGTSFSRAVDNDTADGKKIFVAMINRVCQTKYDEIKQILQGGDKFQWQNDLEYMKQITKQFRALLIVMNWAFV